MKRLRGWTLVELLVVFAIIAVVAAIAYPVTRGALDRAKVSRSISNLHQIGLAINLYRADYGDIALYGTVEEMGLPPDLGALAREYKLPTELFDPGGEVITPEIGSLYTVFFTGESFVGQPSWSKYAKRYQENAILVGDLQNSFAGSTQSISPLVRRRGIGLFVDGSVRVIVKAGDWTKREWWSLPPRE